MRTCTECGATMVPKRRWNAMRPTERACLRAAGHQRTGGRGKCDRCYSRCRYRDAREGQVLKIVPRRDVLEDWQQLADRSLSRAQNIRQLAPRMGMSEAALEKALDRAVRDGELAA